MVLFTFVITLTIDSKYFKWMYVYYYFLFRCILYMQCFNLVRYT